MVGCLWLLGLTSLWIAETAVASAADAAADAERLQLNTSLLLPVVVNNPHMPTILLPTYQLLLQHFYKYFYIFDASVSNRFDIHFRRPYCPISSEPCTILHKRKHITRRSMRPCAITHFLRTRSFTKFFSLLILTGPHPLHIIISFAVCTVLNGY